MKAISVLMMVLTTGCVGYHPYISRDERVVHPTEVRSYTETAQSHTDYIVTEPTIDALSVSATLVQQNHCRDLHYTEFSDQVVQERDQENVLVNLLMAGALGAGSAYLVGHAETLSDEKDPLEPEKLSPQDSARVFGWLGVGTSVIWAGIATVVGFKAIDSNVGPPTSRVTHTHASNQRICTTEPAQGQVVIVRDTDVIHTLALDPSGKFRADIGSNTDWCGFDEGALKFHYEGDLILSAQFKQCAKANLIRKNTSEIEQNALRNPVEIFTALEALGQQQAALGELVGYLDYEDLSNDVAESLEKVRQRGIPIVREYGKTCVSRLADLDDSSLDCVPKTLDAFAALSLDPCDVFEEMFVAQLSREDLAQTSIQAFYAAVPEVQACALRQECPTWLSASTLQTILQPHAQARIKTLRGVLSQAEVARKKLEKQPTLDHLMALGSAGEPIALFDTQWCVKPDYMGMAEVCQEITEFAERFDKTFESSQAKVREDQIKKTAQAWRANFKKCNRLSGGIKKLKEVGNCGNECQQARKKMAADYEALRDFSPENPVWDEPTLTKVRLECEVVGCPRCP